VNTARWAFVGALLAFSSCAAAAHAQSPCPKQWSGKPRVPDAGAAKAIFLAVEKKRLPNAKSDQQAFPDIQAEDDGERWVVFRSKAPVIDPAYAEMTTGGGLQMKIAKCDGRVSEVHLGR
jgi:hypothetical protein